MSRLAQSRFPLVFVLCVLSFPFFAVADTVSGGFPSGSIWLSKTNPTDGDSVQIFAPVYDANASKISGDIVFSVDDAVIGSVHFDLNAGEAKIASIAWNAKAGTHVISARIDNAVDAASKSALSLSGTKTESISVVVAAPPPVSPAVQLLSTAAHAAGVVVSSALPAILSAGQAVLHETESLRVNAKTALEAGLIESHKNADAAQVLGVETGPGTGGSQLAAVGSAPKQSFSPLRILQQIALLIVSSQWLFYPISLSLFLWLFYIVAKQNARPHGVRAA